MTKKKHLQNKIKAYQNILQFGDLRNKIGTFSMQWFLFLVLFVYDVLFNTWDVNTLTCLWPHSCDFNGLDVKWMLKKGLYVPKYKSFKGSQRLSKCDHTVHSQYHEYGLNNIYKKIKVTPPPQKIVKKSFNKNKKAKETHSSYI